jgi:hypothetical protein
MQLEMEILNSCLTCDRTCGEDECLYRELQQEQSIVHIPREDGFISVGEGSLGFITGTETYLRDELKGLEKIESILKDKMTDL